MKAVLTGIVSMVCLLPLAARADIPPPSGCAGSAKGAACTLPEGGNGTCQYFPCVNLGQDAGSCLTCSAQGPDPESPDAGTSNANHGGGCSLAPSSPTVKDAVALAFAGAVSVLFVRRRRRSS